MWENIFRWWKKYNIYKKRHYYRVRAVDSIQQFDKLHRNEIILVGSPSTPKWAILLCTGGCGNPIL